MRYSANDLSRGVTPTTVCRIPSNCSFRAAVSNATRSVISSMNWPSNASIRATTWVQMSGRLSSARRRAGTQVTSSRRARSSKPRMGNNGSAYSVAAGGTVGGVAASVLAAGVEFEACRGVPRLRQIPACW